jgi:RimJ/RimL family protein N-acetyltransferase
MITFERTTDWSTVKAIVTHPKIYQAVSDDGSPAPEQWEPIQNEVAWYVLVKDDAEVLGLWAFYRESVACWQVHTCLLPSAWGEKARDAVRALVPWVWANIPCLRVVTEVPEYNRRALRFAQIAGMTQYGLNPKAYMKGGKLYDIIELGISRPTPHSEMSFFMEKS